MILKRIIAKTALMLELIKFPHTIFAMPFALSSAMLAAGGIPSARQIIWIVLAMVGARSGAMGLNRLIDAEIDAANPRTRHRALPMGLISKGSVCVLSAVSLALMVFAAYMLNPLCFKLSPLAILFLVVYPYTKRLTSLSHIFLGICQFAAPVAAWIAIRGTIDLPAIMIGLAALFWVAGFDIFYSFQDIEFDKAYGLKSIPQKIGIAKSLWVVRFFHLMTVLCLTSLLALGGLGSLFAAGLILIASLLVYEHSLVKEGDLSKLDQAFFTVNGYISLSLLFFTFADVVLFA